MPAYQPEDLDLKKYLDKVPIQVMMATAMVPMPPSYKKAEKEDVAMTSAD